MAHAVPISLPSTIQKHNDWRDDLFRDGYAIVKNAVSPENAASYAEFMTQWLEKFPLGFDRNDPNTWTEEHLPANMKGGMYHGYAISHEKFIWDARLEPGLISAFSLLWNTPNLLVSFDGMNLTLPATTTTTTPRPTPQRWPHQDQDSTIRGFQCAQGILNLLPNGPADGGLVVLRGSHFLNDEFFSSHSTDKNPAWGAVPDDWHGFSEDEVAWFEDRGCEVVKVCCEAGDLVVWDSRTVHYNLLPTAEQKRAVIYICYTPASLASPEDLKKKAEIYQNRERTTHWPHRNFWKATEILRLGQKDPLHRDRPFEEPVESEVLLKLASVMPY